MLEILIFRVLGCSGEFLMDGGNCGMLSWSDFWNFFLIDGFVVYFDSWEKKIRLFWNGEEWWILNRVVIV